MRLPARIWAWRHPPALHDEASASDVEVKVFSSPEDSVARSMLKSKSTAHVVEVETPMVGENSAYPEVRAAVPNWDDPATPQNTLRMWVLGLGLLTAASVLNTLFNLHNPPFNVPPILLMLLAWPLGRLWERIIPNWYGLNPGPFNLKEHSLISVMVAVSSQTYSSDISIVISQFYRMALGRNVFFSLLLCWSTQLIGMSMAGLFRRVLVYPPAMIWPNNLVTVTFLTSIHGKWNHIANGWRITRLNFFLIVMVGCCCWSFVPGLFAQFMSTFSFAAWIAPKNYIINQLFGASSGLGTFPITFDWNQLTGWLGSPLIPPARVFLNVGASLIVFVWITSTVVHYSNVWFGHYLPFADNRMYDRFGKPYVSARVLHGFHLDESLYRAYSPVFMPTTTAISYGLSMAAGTATLMHTLLFDSKRIIKYFRESPEDIHMRLMRHYPEAPMWWYLIEFLVCFAMTLGIVLGYPVGVPVWLMIVALLMAFIFILPVAFITAVTTMTVGINVLAEVVYGYARPGNPLGMMLFKTWTYYSSTVAIAFLESMKLGHYVKLAPRLVFAVQLVGLVWGGTVQILVLQLLTDSVPELCSVDQPRGYSCAVTSTFYSSSLVWGAIGSRRVFDQYGAVLNFIWIGALLPLLAWLWLTKFPRSIVRVIHWPVFFDSLGMLPPAVPYALSCWTVVCVIFGYWIRRYWYSWWAKYNYTLSAALDMGLAVAQLIMFIITVSSGWEGPNWWGNVGYQNNIDAKRLPLKRLPPGEWFGPTKWS